MDLSGILNFGIGSLTLGMLLYAIVIFLVCAIVIRIVNTILGRMLDKAKRLDPTLSGFVRTGAKIVMWAIAIVIIAGSLGIPTASLVALLSIAGLALSLSVQSLMSNLFSGITLLMTKPLSVGDFVEISGKSGTVKNVGLFYTVLDTVDNTVVSIPNADVTAASITNYSAEPLRRVDLTFGAAYSVPTAEVRAAIMDAAAQDERIKTDPAPVVYLKSYNESNISYEARVWCSGTDYWDVYFSLNEQVREAFAAHGVEMTYPHLNVHIDK